MLESLIIFKDMLFNNPCKKIPFQTLRLISLGTVLSTLEYPRPFRMGPSRKKMAPFKV